MASDLRFFFLIFIFLLEYGCFTVWFLPVQQRESAVHEHISPLFWIPLPARSPQGPEQTALSDTAASH